MQLKFLIEHIFWLIILMTDFKEENIVVSDCEEDSEAEAGSGSVQLGTSSLTIRAEITKEIPEFLPIDGKRVRIHYGGMTKQCLKCYKFDHKKIDCKNEKVQWIDYVTDFISKNNFPPRMYGRWYKLVQDKRQEKKTDQDSNPPVQNDQK